jgi:integrase/recombinase XerD
MRVQRVLMPGTDFESWTVLGDDHRPVEPVERFLSFLASIEKSPNTVKAYAHDLKDWMTYLGGHGLDWRTVRIEDVAGSWRGCGCRRRPVTGGWRCCRRWRRTARRRA